MSEPPPSDTPTSDTAASDIAASRMATGGSALTTGTVSLGQMPEGSRYGWLRSPATWATVAIAAFGAVTGFRTGYGAMAAVFVAPTVLATVLLLVTGAIGWYLARRLQPLKRPPRGRCLAALLWGMTGAEGCAILANQGLTSILARTVGPAFANGWGALLVAPVNEELLKVSGLVLLALISGRYLRGPMDGYILGALAGLGFQIAENWHYALSAVELRGGVDGIAAVLWSFQQRVLPIGVGSHWAMSAVAGTGLAVLLTRRASLARVAAGVGLVVVSMAMHAQLDAPLSGGTLQAASLANLVIALAVYLVLRIRSRRASRLPSDSTGETTSQLGDHR